MTTTALRSTSRPVDRGRRTFVLTLVAVAAASATLPFSVTGTAVALPTMARDLGSSVEQTQWVQNAFNVTFASLALASGSLADRFGRRRVLSTGIAVFAVTSLLVAVTPWTVLIDLERAVQGAGAAAVLASGAAVLAHAASGRQRRVAFGVLGASFGSGLALGPLAAGALVEAAGWRSVFLVVAAVAAVAGVCVRYAQESRDPDARGVDVPGLVTFTAGLACVALVFVAATVAGWGAPVTLLAAAGAVVGLLAFVLVESRRPERAMFDLQLFRRPSFVAVVCQPFTITLGFVVLIVYLPPYLQGVTGRSTLGGALVLLPLSAPVLVLPLVGGWLAERTSVRAVLVAASVLNTAGATALLTLGPDATPLGLAGPLLLVGTGVGIAFGVMDNAAVGSVPVQNAGAASGIFNTMRLAGESVAVAGAAALLSTWTAGRLDGDPGAAGRLAGRAVQGAVDGGQRDAIVAGLTSAFHVVAVILAVLSAFGAVLTWLALRSAERT